MLFPPHTSSVLRLLLASPALVITLVFSACNGHVVPKTEAEALSKVPEAKPAAVPLWLGNSSRNFYGTGPWSAEPVKVLWEFETQLISGRLHEEGWGEIGRAHV